MYSTIDTETLSLRTQVIADNLAARSYLNSELDGMLNNATSGVGYYNAQDDILELIDSTKSTLITTISTYASLGDLYISMEIYDV